MNQRIMDKLNRKWKRMFPESYLEWRGKVLWTVYREYHNELDGCPYEELGDPLPWKNVIEANQEITRILHNWNSNRIGTWGGRIVLYWNNDYCTIARSR